MKGTLVVIFVAVSAVFFILCGSALFSQESPKGYVSRVGVVDLREISQKWKKWADLAESVEKEEKAGQSKIEEEEKKIAEMEAKLARSAFAKNSEEYLKECTVVQAAKLRVDWLKARETERMVRLAGDYGKGLLTEIESAIKKYGRENGFSLILKIDEVSLEDRSWEQMQTYVRFKQVLFYEDGINITPAIVDILQKK